MIGAESRLISFVDGGGEPSTQPFQPFRTAGRFLRGRGSGGGGGDTLVTDSISSSSMGVCGLLDEVREVLEDVEGSGVDAEESGMGGGVTEIDRGIMMFI
jgi:hypothetical protein